LKTSGGSVDKQVISYNEELKEEADTTKSDSVMAAENNPAAREYYLKDLPFTEEQLAILTAISWRLRSTAP